MRKCGGALFASLAYIERRGAPKSFDQIANHDVVQFDGPIAQHPGARWLKKVAPHARIAARCASTPALVLAVKSGAAISPLPIIAVEDEPDVIRLFNSIPELTLPFYMLIHRDMQRTPRVRAFCDFVADQKNAFRDLLVGRTDQRGH